MQKLLILLAPLALTACGADVAGACENYFAAIEACTTEYGDSLGIDMSASFLPDTYCEDTYGDINDKESEDYLNCLADVYDNADCTTDEGYAAAGTDATACVL